MGKNTPRPHGLSILSNAPELARATTEAFDALPESAKQHHPTRDELLGRVAALTRALADERAKWDRLHRWVKDEICDWKRGTEGRCVLDRVDCEMESLESSALTPDGGTCGEVNDFTIFEKCKHAVFHDWWQCAEGHDTIAVEKSGKCDHYTPRGKKTP